MPKPLTESVLKRLTTEALTSFLGQAENFEAVLYPGCDLTLCNEPVADLNYLVAGSGASDSESFGEACRMCLDRQQPFLAIIFPEAGDGVKEVAAAAGLVHVVDFPMMVLDDVALEPAGNEVVEVRLAASADDMRESGRVVSAAFHMPEESVHRVLPPAVIDSPGLDVFLASIDGRVVGSVALTHQGDTTGVWAMASDPEQQGQGIGRRLLSTAIAETRSRGVKRFYLGATPAGLPLYESLGFKTQVVTQVWAFGESGQT